eukprot:1724024-Rhodomonas_salina.1
MAVSSAKTMAVSSETDAPEYQRISRRRCEKQSTCPIESKSEVTSTSWAPVDVEPRYDAMTAPIAVRSSRESMHASSS